MYSYIEVQNFFHSLFKQNNKNRKTNVRSDNVGAFDRAICKVAWNINFNFMRLSIL